MRDDKLSKIMEQRTYYTESGAVPAALLRSDISLSGEWKFADISSRPIS